MYDPIYPSPPARGRASATDTNVSAFRRRKAPRPTSSHDRSSDGRVRPVRQTLKTTKARTPSPPPAAISDQDNGEVIEEHSSLSSPRRRERRRLKSNSTNSSRERPNWTFYRENGPSHDDNSDDASSTRGNVSDTSLEATTLKDDEKTRNMMLIRYTGGVTDEHDQQAPEPTTSE